MRGRCFHRASEILNQQVAQTSPAWREVCGSRFRLLKAAAMVWYFRAARPDVREFPRLPVPSRIGRDSAFAHFGEIFAIRNQNETKNSAKSWFLTDLHQSPSFSEISVVFSVTCVKSAALPIGFVWFRSSNNPMESIAYEGTPVLPGAFPCYAPKGAASSAPTAWARPVLIVPGRLILRTPMEFIGLEQSEMPALRTYAQVTA